MSYDNLHKTIIITMHNPDMTIEKKMQLLKQEFNKCLIEIEEWLKHDELLNETRAWEKSQSFTS